MFAILATDGQVSINEVHYECAPGKWIPIFVYRDAKNPDVPVVPLFHQEKDAKTFIKRNVPAEWVRGGVHVTARDIAWMRKQGWQIEEMSYPRRMTDLKDIQFGVELQNLEPEPDVMVGRL